MSKNTTSETLCGTDCNQPELQAAFADGLDRNLFAEACELGLDVAAFTAMLAQRVDSMEEVNVQLERFIASPGEVVISPDPLVAAFNRLHREGGFCNPGTTDSE